LIDDHSFCDIVIMAPCLFFYQEEKNEMEMEMEGYFKDEMEKGRVQ